MIAAVLIAVAAAPAVIIRFTPSPSRSEAAQATLSTGAAS
jgi:hypothetical protein